MKPASRASTWVRRTLLAITIAFSFSCTRMPTAPRIQVTVEGRISGPSGEPLEGAVVSFESGEAVWTGWAYAVTDSLGLYTVSLLAGKYAVSVYPPDDYATPVHEDRVALSSSHRRYDFRFQGFRVTGRVTGPTGAPIDSGYVSAQSTGPARGGARSPLRNGSYLFLLPASTYAFYASDADYLSGLPGRSIAGVPITADTTIDIELNGIAVSGHVYGPDGLPMGGVRVRVEYLVQNVTKVDGSYLLYAPPGNHRVWFEPPYPFYIFPRVTDPVTIGSPISIDGDLSGVEWTGTVRRLDTGESVSDVTLVVTQVGDELNRAAAIRSGPQGEFRFVLERARSYDLKTYDPGTSEPTIRLQDVAATTDTTFDILVP